MGLLDGVLKSVVPLAASFVPGLGQAAGRTNVLGSGGAQVQSTTLGDPLPGNTGAPSGPITLGSSGTSEEEKVPLGGRIKSGLKKANNVLGSDAGRLAQNVGGQFLGDARQLRNTKKHQEYLKSEGLNPWEAATGARGAAPTPTTSIGAAPSAVSGGHPSQKKVGQEITNLKAQRAKIDAEARVAELTAEWYVPFKWATLGPENMKAMLASFNSGLPYDVILRGAGSMTAEQSVLAEALLARFLEITKGSGGALGWIELGRNLGSSVMEKARQMGREVQFER